MEVTHPWCIFDPVKLTLHDDGTFQAVVNNTKHNKYPIPVKHHANQDMDPLNSLMSPKIMLIGGSFMIGIQLIKRYASRPDVQHKIIDMQKEMQEQREALKQQAK